MRQAELLRDLRYLTGLLIREAQAGDEPARQWLVTSFPGHIDHFLTLWSAVDEAPRGTNAPHSRPVSGAQSRGRNP